MNMRDDFSASVKRTVAARVNYTCSICNAATSGPQLDSSKSVNVGVAAHITAASVGGPRYDPELTQDERRSPLNAIWLCHNCGKLVDNDEARFTTAELMEWKRRAEADAMARLGKAARVIEPSQANWTQEELLLLIGSAGSANLPISGSKNVDYQIQREPEAIQEDGESLFGKLYTDAVGSLIDRGLIEPASNRTFRLTERGLKLARSLEEQRVNPSRLVVYPFSIASTLRSIGERFVSRERELERIHSALSPDRVRFVSGSSPVFVVEGVGGIGKTQLLKEYCHRFGAGFDGGIFWIQANTDENHLWLQHREILRDLGVPYDSDRRKSPSITHVLERALSRLCNVANVLVIIDDVVEPDGNQIVQPITHWLPVPPKTSILVSSKVRLSLHETGAEGLLLGPIPDSEAIRLLKAGITTSQIPDDSWGRIVKLISGHPLALELINRLLVFQVNTVEEILSTFTAGSKVEALQTRQAFLDGVLPKGQIKSLHQTFEESYQRLPQEAQQLARTVSLLAAVPIPTTLLEEIGSKFAPSNSRSVLASRSLISSVNETDGASIGFMHPLVADFIRGKIADDMNLLEVVVNAIKSGIGSLNKRFLADQKDLENESHVPFYVAHAEHLFWVIIKANEPFIAGGAFKSLTEKDDFLFVAMVATLADGKEPESIVRRYFLVTHVLDMGEAVSELLALGGARDRAVDVEQTIVEYRFRMLGEGSRRLIVSLDHLGIRLAEAGKSVEAIAAHERAVALAEQAFGVGDRDLIIALDNLGRTLRSGGQSEQAIVIQGRALRMAWTSLGCVASDSMICAWNLWETVWAFDECAGSTEQSKRGLDELRSYISEAVTMENLPDKISMLASNMAQVFFRAGDLVGAERMGSALLRIEEEANGLETIRYLHSLLLLAQVKLGFGDLDYARNAGERAVDLIRRHLELKNPISFLLCGNIGELLRRTGRLREAYEVVENALSASMSALPATHSTVRFLEQKVSELRVEMERNE
jgi:tetratricopeptide (TPR) repeat protein